MPTPRTYATAAQRQAAYRRRCQERLPVGEGRPRVPARPGRPRWEALCGQARSLLAQVAQEMELHCEDRSEAWQESDRGQAFTDTITAIEEIGESLAEVSLP
jgi:hypothetical protein